MLYLYALMDSVLDFSYILAAMLFILGIKMLGKANTAKRGNLLSSLGMLIAVISTLLNSKIIDYRLILLGLLIGTMIGSWLACHVKMTAMPEMVAMLNGFGGLASLLVGVSEYINVIHFGWVNYLTSSNASSIYLIILSIISAIFIGGITFSGSMVAYLKLSGKISPRAFLFKWQNFINLGICLLVISYTIFNIISPESAYARMFVFYTVILSLVLGVTITLPIGGGDMPVVISMLNSLSGLAAAAAGFIIVNSVLIVAGCLVGASGFILTIIMCKSMNRSLLNVLFSGFGNVKQRAKTVQYSEPIVSSVEDAYFVLEAARSVVFVPGYGMAVAQAQHAVKELSQILEDNGAEVQFAIHPVAGRMPGHMNVLLAEANVDYDKLIDMETINRNIQNIDVAIVIGANDVVNPAAADEPGSPIYGMPIINAHLAKTVFVLKRGKGTGFSGLQNKLFSLPNVRMLYGDAKQTMTTLIASFKE